MALRDRLAQRATPFLEPGEQIQAIFLAQSGNTVLGRPDTVLGTMLSAGYATVVVTDRAIVVLRNDRLTGGRAKSLRDRLPRQPMNNPSGLLWAHADLGGTRYWIRKPFHKDVSAANAAILSGVPADDAG
jgi:hypothetical protein